MVAALGECASRSIIHRDISYHNILLYKSPDSLDSLRRGLLVDFDCALKLEEADSPAIPSVAALSRVGNHAVRPDGLLVTYPFNIHPFSLRVLLPSCR